MIAHKVDVNLFCCSFVYMSIAKKHLFCWFTTKGKNETDKAEPGDNHIKKGEKGNIS